MPHDEADGHEVHLRERSLPGGARLYQVRLSDGTIVSITTEAGSVDRGLSITPPGADEPSVSLRLVGPEATTVSALLSGVRFLIDSEGSGRDRDVTGADPEQPLGGANSRTVTLPAGSPAVGRTLHDLDVPDPQHARVVAVIRDDTPELIEADVDRPCQPGDRLLLVGRPDAMGNLVRYLQG